MTLQQLFVDLNSTTVITGMTLDSRAVKPGFLFVALVGQQVDGHDYAVQALANGAVAVVSERPLKLGVPNIVRPNLRHQVSHIAAEFYGHPSRSLTIVGVTGTNGKSTVCDLTRQCFQALGYKAVAMGTLGVYGDAQLPYSGNTTADPITLQANLAELVAQGVTHVAMEVSSHALVQSRAAAVHFDVGVFTNLSRDHLDFHGDMDSYALAKQHLFVGLQPTHWVLNAQTPAAMGLAPLHPDSQRVVTYGATADVSADAIQFAPSGLTFDLHLPGGHGQIVSSLLGGFNIDNLLAVAAILLSQGIDESKIIALLSQVESVPGRMEVVSNAPTVIVDYAHTPEGLSAALQATRQHCQGQVWVVFGAGGDRDAGKRAPMGRVCDELADHCVVTSDNPRSENPDAIIDDVVAGMSVGYHREADRVKAIQWLIASMQSDDVALVAGKGHETEQVLANRVIRHDDRDCIRQALAEVAS